MIRNTNKLLNLINSMLNRVYIVKENNIVFQIFYPTIKLVVNNQFTLIFKLIILNKLTFKINTLIMNESSKFVNFESL
jgi:hypothetical protein